MASSAQPSRIPIGPVLAETLGKSHLETAATSQPQSVVFIERLGESNLAEYSAAAFALFEHSFPNPDEREPLEDIVQRIRKYSQDGPDADGGEFHAHVYLDDKRRVIAYAQGSVMPCGKAGLCYFWQYGAVADEAFLTKQYGLRGVSSRKGGVSKVMHRLHDVTLETAATNLEVSALGELWESEQKGLGETDTDISFTFQRLHIHSRSGGRVLLGVSGNHVVNLHLQPRLSKETAPIALHLMFRPLKPMEQMSIELGRAVIVEGFLQNFLREGFDETDVREAMQDINRRLDSCSIIKLLAAGEVPDVVALASTDAFLAKQVLEMYQVASLEDARKRLDAAAPRD